MREKHSHRCPHLLMQGQRPMLYRCSIDILQMLSMESQVLRRFSRYLADSCRLSIDAPDEASDTQQAFCRCSHGVSDFFANLSRLYYPLPFDTKTPV